MGRVGFFFPIKSHLISSAMSAMHGTCTPHKYHANPIKKVSPFYVIYIQYIFSISASLGGASRPPVHPPGTAAHGRVLARSASEAGAERQRSARRQVQRGPSRSRSTRGHIRGTHGTCRGRTGRQQPPAPDNPARCAECCGLRNGAGVPAERSGRCCCAECCGLRNVAGVPAERNGRCCCA